METLLAKSKEKSISTVSNLFSSKPLPLPKKPIAVSIPVQKKQKDSNINQSQSQSLKEKIPSIRKKVISKENNKPAAMPLHAEDELPRDPRTIFVGNVNRAIKKRKLLTLFKPYGKIESSWQRSIPVQIIEGKSVKESLKQKRISETGSTVNYYILFTNEKVRFLY